MNTYVKICISVGVLFVFFIFSYLFIAKLTKKTHKKTHKIEHDIIKSNLYEKMSKRENNNYQTTDYEENNMPLIYTDIPPPQHFPIYVERDYIIQRPLNRRRRRRAIFKALAQTKDEINKDFRSYSILK